MSIRSVFISGLLGLCLLAPPASAELPRAGDHLSYYTYYKTKSGETVSGLASKFGLAESSLLRMNPQLSHLQEDALPDGSLICVPKEDPPEVAVVRPKLKKSSAEDSEAEEPAEPKKSKRQRTSKEKEEPNDAEWDQLAELATKGAPTIADERVTRSAAPSSKLIRPNGEVVWIPAAKPAPAPKPKTESRSRRTKLSSRKGKAIHGVLNTCRSYMGTPYVWGGEQPGGFDCSGYVQYVFAKHGYRLPRTADIQYNVGQKVNRGDEKPGDLVFFETYLPGPSHVGVFLGRGYFIHASSSRGVTVDRLSTDFFAQRYLGAKRNKY
jgi:cell wall-associated NlpC family hydrolase